MADDILIVDDEKDIRALLGMMLEDEGYDVTTASNANEARTALLANPPKLAILDIWMRESDMDGIELLEWVKSVYPQLPVLMISGHGTIETAVQAIRLGAYDFIEKPFKEARLLMTVERALDNARLSIENNALRARVRDDLSAEIIGHSSSMRAVRQSIAKVAPTASRVLIGGPNGSGKELAARAIHAASARGHEQFIVANCARLATERVDVELFGAENLQSHRRVVGLFEQAHRGTLYFDEICDLPVETQGKIVRAVNEQRFRRVGGNSEVTVDVRVISASSKDLPTEIREGRLREDLYYRLGVVPLTIPPLANRREDIPLLAKYFAKRLAQNLGVRPIQFSDEVFAALQSYDWPGNVRQIQNIIETMLIMAPAERDLPVGLDLLPAEIQNLSRNTTGAGLDTFMALPLRGARELFEKQYLETQLSRFDGNISRMAVFIGMERSALHRKMKALDISANLQDEESKA